MMCQDAQQNDQRIASAERGELTTIGEIRNAWEQQIGQRVSRSTIYRLLHRHGWHKLTPRPRHPKANTAELAVWLRAFPDQVQAALSIRDPTDQRPVRKMAQDESRFGRISRPRRAWAPPRMRPRTACQHVRESTYVYAAVAPEQGEVISLILPEVSTAMMQLFLDHVSASYANSFLVMQLDQAAWHQTKELRVPETIRLISQPAYSPELNPTEKLWEELREKQFPNVACTSLDEVMDRLCQGLNQLEAQPDRLRQMTFSPISVRPVRPGIVMNTSLIGQV